MTMLKKNTVTFCSLIKKKLNVWPLTQSYHFCCFTAQLFAASRLIQTLHFYICPVRDPLRSENLFRVLLLNAFLINLRVFLIYLFSFRFFFFCLFVGDKELLAYFYGPVGFLLLVNLLLFASTARQLTCGLWKRDEVKSTSER